MLGNVWEWCSDSWRDNYETKDEESPIDDEAELPDIDDDDLKQILDGVGKIDETESDSQELPGIDDDELFRKLNEKTEKPAYQVLRGGSFLSEEWQCRSANRNKALADYRYKNCGFRVAIVEIDDIGPLEPLVTRQDFDNVAPLDGFDDDLGGGDDYLDDDDLDDDDDFGDDDDDLSLDDDF